MKLGIFTDEKGRERRPNFPEEHGSFQFDETDYLLYALLCDPVYCAELLCQDPSNRDYGGCYAVRDYQYVLNRGMGSNYEGYACGRSTGKTESIKNRALAHVFRRMPGQNLLVTAPELIHLLPLTDAIEDRITGCRLTRGFLDVSNNSTGFQHRPFQANFLDGTKIIGRIPRISGTGVKGQHQPDLIIDECFPPDTLILTEDGLRPIVQVEIGDRVLTHRGRYRRVTAVARRFRKTCEVIGQGHPGLTCSTHHPFWARQQVGAESRDGHRRRVFSSAAFVSAADLAPADGYPSDNRIRRGAFYWSSPTDFPELAIPDVPCVVNDDFWWLLGLFLAEGSVSKRGDQVTFSVHRDEAERVKEAIAAIGLDANVCLSCADLGARVTPRAAKEYAQWLEQEAGRIAKDHEVPTWVLGADRRVRGAVLSGYVYGDGNAVKDSRCASGRWQATSADLRLALSVKMLAQSLGYTVGIYRTEVASRGTVQYQIRGNRRSQTAERIGKLEFAIVRRVTPTEPQWLHDLTVDEDHSFVAEGIVVSNSQDYPDAGWTEVHETVEKSIPDFSYVFYGVHSGDRATGFHKRITQGGFKIHTVTAMQRPTWNAAEKNAARAAYGGSQAPDYRRNILGEAGGASSPLFNLARLVSCMEQDRESPYNLTGYKYQEIRSEEFDEMMLPISDLLDLPSGLKTVWAGADLGLTNAPTVITIWSEEKVKGERRLKLVRRIHLVRMRTRVIRHAIYALFDHFGGALQGFGMDETGLGAPIFQEIEDDEAKPEGIMERFSGWFFNAKTPVGLERTHLRQDERGQWKDQYGSAVEERVNELTGAKEYVIYMPMIEASTRYLREFVDSGFMMLPFDPEVISDMTGETTQRVRRIAGLKSKPNAFHILDSMRAMSMAYKRASVEAQLAVPEQVPVLDIAV